MQGRAYVGLDLGCGTGLGGLQFRAIAMLAQAKQKNCYDELIEADILSFLTVSERHYDLILCIDTLVYFGALTELCQAVQRTLAPTGLFTFSVELTEKHHPTLSSANQWPLSNTLKAHILQLAQQHQLHIHSQYKVIGRYQQNEQVSTGLFFLENQCLL